MKLCTVCGVVTSRPGSRCTTHAQQSNRSRHNALYSTRAWQSLSARVIARHRGQYGNHCPGYQRPSHPAGDLTVDHVVPLAAGGAPLDIANCAVLCRSCNSTKGASEPDRGYPHAGPEIPEDRAKRFVVLVLSKTFYGREDPGLLTRLLPELPGIMNWALEGLDRLRARRRFSEPGSAREAIRELEDLSSPMSAFLRDRCAVGRDMHVSVDDLWAAWKAWAEDQSQHHGTKQTFGRDLRAVVPGLYVSRPRDGEHKRGYVGLALAAEGNNVADRGPRGPFGPEDVRGPHGPRTSALLSQRPAALEDAGPDIERPANDDGWPGDETGPSDEASVTDDGLDVAREALRIFADDLTDESAARLKAVVDGADGFGWGGLA